MTNASIPQRDTAAERAERARSLAWARTLYTWAHSHTYNLQDGSKKVLEPIAVLNVDQEHPFPRTQDVTSFQIFEITVTVINLLGLVITAVTNLLDVDAPKFDAPPPASFLSAEPHEGHGLRGLIGKVEAKVEGAAKDVEHAAKDAVKDVAIDVEEVVADVAVLDVMRRLSKLRREFVKLHARAEEAFETTGQVPPNVSADLGVEFNQKLGDLVHLLYRSEDIAPVLELAGLRGRPVDLEQYGSQFQTVVTPNGAGDKMTDATFARMRVAGPNPLLLTRVRGALPTNFPVDPVRFASLTRQPLDAAIENGRVYYVDYAPLQKLVPSVVPYGPKYPSAPLALFVLSEDRTTLMPVAIQLGQTPGAQVPVFYCDDGVTWDIAKIHVQSADGNYHELISHLGLTHLLIEPFVVSTHRNLAQNHPIFRLLLPHFQGTLFINWSAITTLIAPGGTVDDLLAGTIESDWTVTATALGTLDFNAHMLPNDLAARGVDDPALLPSYPYRDDATLLWKAIETWVGDYVGLYYTSDADVASDEEIQSWYADLTSQNGGCLTSLGERGEDGKLGLFSLNYLTRVLTMVIFTSSVQHATVNFPQLSIMSYTPSMPLATYAPPPTHVDPELPRSAQLDHLPPLQMANLQLLLGQLLGGIYFTRLGQYDRNHRASRWFKDPRVNAPLDKFHRKLGEIEEIIAAHNLRRPVYDTLLPSRIPQSINI